MRQQFTLTIPMADVITSNRDARTWKRTKTKNVMRALTRVAARDRYPVGRATIWIGITKRTGTLYDPQNLVDTFKGCVDELVTMGLLDEDNHQHVAGPWLYHEAVDKNLPAGHMRATVTLTDYHPTPL